MDLKTSLKMVVSDWRQPISGLHISPTEFYGKLGAVFSEMDIPNAKISRIWRKESPLISAKREYFRIERYRCVFDIGCAPFGKGSFISSWLCIVPFCLSLFHILGMILLGMVALTLFSFVAGGGSAQGPFEMGHTWRAYPAIIMGAISVIAVVVHIPLWWFISKLRDDYVFVNSNVASDVFCGMTIIGPVLLMWAQGRPTYYQLDSAALFQAAVHDATMEVLDEYMNAQKVQLLTESERAPIMREFLKKR